MADTGCCEDGDFCIMQDGKRCPDIGKLFYTGERSKTLSLHSSTCETTIVVRH
jgi:hypothetical protein